MEWRGPSVDVVIMKTSLLRSGLAGLAVAAAALVLTGCDDAYIPSEHQRAATEAEAVAALDAAGHPPTTYTGLRMIDEDYWCAGGNGGTTCWWLYYDRDRKAAGAWTPLPDEVQRLTGVGVWPSGAVPG